MDVLISDYSSVVFDSLLMRKPIIIYAYDENRYEMEERGLYFGYEKLNIGLFVKNYKELEKAIFYLIETKKAKKMTN